MGKLSSPSHPEPTINHFTHPHPLNLSFSASACCTICNINISGLIYTCTPCNYNIHINCAQMPQQIKHQSHQQHPLSLLPKPAYPDGLFTCNACGKHGNGFNYHCRACKLDLHIKCSSMPLKVTHNSHHHSLDLTFSIPYQNNIFSCDVCKNMGSKEWLYRCNLCEFDSHLNCATMEPRSNQFLGTQLTERSDLMNSFHENYMNSYNNQLKLIMEGIATNNSNASLMAMQALNQNSHFRPPVMGGVSGGGVDFLGGINGGGGANHLQALMGGGGGGVNHLQALMGGGGGANNLQALMGGGYGGVGGGGGANIYQAMMGGGLGGGGSGAELMQAMMGIGSGGGLNAFGGGGGAGNLLQAFMGGGGGVADLLGGGGGGLSVDSLSGILGSLSGLGGLG